MKYKLETTMKQLQSNHEEIYEIARKELNLNLRK